MNVEQFESLKYAEEQGHSFFLSGSRWESPTPCSRLRISNGETEKEEGLDKHVGGIKCVHNQGQEKYNFFMKPKTGSCPGFCEAKRRG